MDKQQHKHEVSPADSEADFSVGAQASQDALDPQTVEFQTTHLADRETDRPQSAMEGATVEHTPLPSPAKGVVPDTFAVEATLPTAASGGKQVTAGRSSFGAQRKFKSLVGSTLGEYRIDSELGRGGMGVVYRAHHQKLRRDVAIKMILGPAASDRQALERFEVEARAVASLQHPNVVQLFEFGGFNDSPFVALEFVEGGTLGDRLKEFPLEPAEAAHIVETLARAMQAAHDQGILHRDLKPANILLTGEGVPKISDFGLAKNLVANNQDDTKTGTVMGTPSFMSPEQALGQISQLSGATDQYSLGAILYACVSGRPPFMAASTIETITQVVHREPVPLRQLTSSIPVDLETICLKALQKDPAKRYANCTALADDLRRFRTGEPISARPISRLERHRRWCKRNPSIAVPTGLAAMFIIATAGISSWAWAATSAQAAIIAEQRDNVSQERDEAQKQRDEARRQTILADQQKAMAEDNAKLAQKQANLALKNIQFVVTDVDTQLRQQPGMSEIRIGILEAVSAKWDELNVELAGGVRGEAVPTLMAVRQLLGVTFADLDRLKQAQDEFIKLEEMGRERIAVKGRTDSARTNLAKILLASAPLYRRLDENPLAGIAKLEEALGLVREVINDPQPQEGSPSQNEILQLQSSAAMNLGVEYLREGRIEDTDRVFSEALAANTQVLDNIRGAPGFDELNDDQKDTQTAALQIALDKSRLGVAYIRLRLGKTEEALPLYEAALASRREIFNRRSGMLIMKSELAGHLKLYGKSLLWIDKIDEAAPKLREAAQLADEAWQADPEKVDLKRGLAESLYLFGTLRELQGQSDEALALFERSRLLRAELYESSPDEKNRINLMLSEASLGNVDAAQQHADALQENKLPNSELHLERARTLAMLMRYTEGEQRTALKQQALDALQRAIDEGFSDPFRIGAETELKSLHDTDRFAGIVRRLQDARLAEKSE